MKVITAKPCWTRMDFLPIECVAASAGSQVSPQARQPNSQRFTPVTGDFKMGKGNNSQKNDKKAMKPKQDKSKAAAKKQK
jgi:hypothetical protein